MKKIMLVLFIVFYLCGCSVLDDREVMQVPTESGQTQCNESEPTPTPEPTPAPEPTPVSSIKSVALPTDVSDNEQFLTHLNGNENSDFVTEMGTSIEPLISPGDDAYYVEFNQDRMSNLQLDRPDMPTYTWYINGSNADKIAEVVIEFDILETIHSLHPGYFGYDKGYFITLHHFQQIPLFSFWCEPNYSDPDVSVRSDVERDTMISMPEFGEDLRKYAKQEGKHVIITIPYSEFQSTSKDLTLQFLPGTTFANLSVNIWGAETLNTDMIDEIFKPLELPTRDLLHDVILPILQTSGDKIISYSDTDSKDQMESLLWVNDIIAKGLVINPDGSINMPVSFYDLGAYQDEVQGKYAVIPEGLVPALMTLSSYSFLGGNCNADLQQWKNHKRMVIDFILENMMDETGQFYGVYDIDQGKLVAEGRKSPALPILSAMLMTKESGALRNDEIDFIVNSIIANNLIRVGDKLYYAPYGISDDGIMELKLSDFAISSELFEVFMEYSNDRSRLDEEYGCAMLLEGFANSLKLILEAQEQNKTRLPASELKVIFADCGNSYELQPSDTFDINNTYFAVGLKSMPYHWLGVVDNGRGPFSELKFEKTHYACADKLSSGKDGVYSEEQKRYIRECEAQYSEIYNAYTIQTLFYESWLNIYNFLQIQPSETAYAAKYNVHTGEMIEASADALYPEFSTIAPMIQRFGTPATPMLYHLLVGIFNDEKTIRETAYLVMVDFNWYVWVTFGSQPYDYSDPDFFADNGFNIWGYDSLRCGFRLTSSDGTWDPYNKCGLNFNREDWKEYTMRKLNERARSEEEFVELEDEFPLFYDHLPEIIITD